MTGLPPFTVRRAEILSKSLDRFAIARGYVGIPIYSTLNRTVWSNPTQYDSCPVAE